jgi:cytochrome b subunit of formate dehydrogenase
MAFLSNTVPFFVFQFLKHFFWGGVFATKVYLHFLINIKFLIFFTINSAYFKKKKYRSKGQFFTFFGMETNFPRQKNTAQRPVQNFL